MQFSEAIVVQEVDRIIQSSALRIERQRLHIHDPAASAQQVKTGTVVLRGMVEGLERLKLYRANFA